MKEVKGMDNINDLYDLCEVISREISEATEKIYKSGGKLTAGDVDFVDKLTHSLKSIKAVIAMVENNDHRGGYFREGGSYYEGGGSMARGRGRYASRDSMGRYSGYGYSRTGGDFVKELHELMESAPNDHIRMDIQRLAEKVEQSM